MAEGGREVAVSALNVLLRGELAAVETYRLALARLPPSFRPRPALAFCLRSHAARAERYRELVAARGGLPSDGPGAWGTWARFVTDAAQILGSRAVIAALHEGEDHGLRDYAAVASRLDAAARRVVMEELLPDQQETHDQMGIVRASLPP